MLPVPGLPGRILRRQTLSAVGGAGQAPRRSETDYGSGSCRSRKCVRTNDARQGPQGRRDACAKRRIRCDTPDAPESQRFGVLSEGAFDISVQPLWRLYEAHFWSRQNVVDDVTRRAAEVVRESVDFRNIETSAAAVSFTRPHMGITLNSVAQGFITD